MGLTKAQQERLDELANTISFNKQVMAKLETEYDAAWKEALDIMGKDAPWSYEAPTGTLKYVKRGGEEQLNERSLLEHIREQYPNNWREIWWTITDEAPEDDRLLLRSLDQERLADLMSEEKLDPKEFIEASKVTFARTVKK